MTTIKAILDFIKSEGAGKFIDICRSLFTVLIYYITDGKSKVTKLIEARKKYNETGDITILEDIINK
jgi:hypothetical protein